MRKCNSCNAVMAPLLSPLVLDDTRVHACLIPEIAAVIAVVTEWLIIPAWGDESYNMAMIVTVITRRTLERKAREERKRRAGKFEAHKLGTR